MQVNDVKIFKGGIFDEIRLQLNHGGMMLLGLTDFVVISKGAVELGAGYAQKNQDNAKKRVPGRAPAAKTLVKHLALLLIDLHLVAIAGVDDPYFPKGENRYPENMHHLHPKFDGVVRLQVVLEWKFAGMVLLNAE